MANDERVTKVFLRIPNLERYQHYRERKPPWVKQYRDFWTDYDLSTLPTSARLLGLFLISFASEFENGAIPHNISEISRRVSMQKRTVSNGLDLLISSGFVQISTRRALARRKQNAKPLVQRTEREKEKEANASLRPRDELWDILVQEIGPVATKSERGRRNAALKELRAIGATPVDVTQRCDVYRRRWPAVDLTATALVANWSLLAKESLAKGPTRLADISLDDVFSESA